MGNHVHYQLLKHITQTQTSRYNIINKHKITLSYNLRNLSDFKKDQPRHTMTLQDSNNTPRSLWWSRVMMYRIEHTSYNIRYITKSNTDLVLCYQT